MKGILKKVIDHRDSYWFREPVDPVALNLPTYTRIVKEPMDLGTVSRRLTAGELDSAEFIRLIKLVFENCARFNNANTLVYISGQELNEFFEKILNEALELAGRSSPKPPVVKRGTKSSDSPQQKAEKSKTTTPPQPVLSEYDKKNLEKIIDELMHHHFAAPFNEPVDPVALKIPLYPKLIKTPMDLSTIKSKLAHSPPSYPTVELFKNDVLLVFRNCVKFNGPKADISKWANELKQFFLDLWSELGYHTKQTE